MIFLNKKQITVKSVISSIMILTLLLLGTSCDKKSATTTAKSNKEILIYCGITMIRPISELAAIIEDQEKCKIIITKGGSGNLLKSIVYNKAGDLYLPGSERYYKIIDKKYAGLVIDTVFVGYNKAAIMVQKGNPKNISSDLINLASREYGVIIGNPESGSIGKEAGKILEKRGILKEVIKNVMSLTTDSKDLVKAIKTKKADIVINWFAVSCWDDNPQYMDVIDIKPKYAKKKKLILGRLKFSKHPDLAVKFMELASSDKGKEIFKKHGFYFE